MWFELGKKYFLVPYFDLKNFKLKLLRPTKRDLIFFYVAVFFILLSTLAFNLYIFTRQNISAYISLLSGFSGALTFIFGFTFPVLTREHFKHLTEKEKAFLKSYWIWRWAIFLETEGDTDEL